MEFHLEQALNMGLPAVFAATILLAAFAPWKKDEYKCYWAGAMIMGIGYTIGHWRIAKLPSWEQDSWQWEWLFFLAIAATVLGLIDALTKLPLKIRIGLVVTMAIATCYLIVPNWVEKQLLLQITLGIAIVSLCLGLDRAAENTPGVFMPLALIICTTGASGFLALSGQAKFAQLIAVLAVLSGVALAIAWWNPTLSLTKGACFPIAVVFLGILFSGYFNMDSEDTSVLSTTSYVLLTLAPFATLSFQTTAKWLQNKKKLHIIFSYFLILLPILIALGITWMQQRGADTNSYPY